MVSELVALERRARHAEAWAEKQAKFYRIERSRAEKAEAELREAADRIQALEAALTAVRKRTKNARGAIESDQVVDKDVHGSLSWVLETIDAALEAKP